MASVPLAPPLIPSPISSSSSGHDKISTIKTANFAQIPSWVSLKGNSSSSSSSSSLKTDPNHHHHHQGKLENLHLLSLSKQGNLKQVREFLKEMDAVGVSVTPESYQCIFETCGRLRSLVDGKLFHDRLRTTVQVTSPSGILYLENCVLRMFCECGSFSDAQKLFDDMLIKDFVSWSIVISAYVGNGLFDKAFAMFSDMLVSEIRPNLSIYNILLRPLTDNSLLELGKQMHCHLIKSGLSTNVSIETTVLNMYVKCGWFEGAKCVFDLMVERNAVTWTAFMVGCNQAGQRKYVVELFARMVREGVQLDDFVFSVVLKACSGLEDLDIGRQIHSHIVKLGLDSEVSVGTPLVDFYAKCGRMESACLAFEMISEPSDVSWSAIITGYCQAGKFQESIQLFQSVRSRGVISNPFIYTSIFQACSALADLNMGAQAHGDAIKRGLISFLYGDSAIITMYSKCGRLDYAQQAFESMDEPDTVAWTAIISGCAYHGNAPEALSLFKRMNEIGVRPNAVTFIAVLTACSHSGSVTEAKQLLDSMSNAYGVEPTIDHYDCMIDVYSRAGLLHEALELIKNMPFETDTMSWKSLLGGCWTHRNLELGKIAADKLLLLDPEDTASYIVMFNLYASAGKWEAAAHYRKMLVERNLRKEISCSWITAEGKVHQFIVGDRHHPRTKDIYSKLKELTFSVSTTNGNPLMNEDDISYGLPERKEQLLDHSEKLAIAFGLISTSSNAPMLVFKNLRACKDCHDFAKKVSMITGREIVVRDSSRFHHFKSGQCSCNDYW